MDISLTLRDDIYWQDGKQFTAYDIKFCLEFLRDYQVPRYAGTWQTLLNVSVTDATHLTIHANKAGLDLFYDYAHLATMLPEHIWNRFGNPSDPANRQAALEYDPTEQYNTAPGYSAGLTPTPTNIVGTGPWTFQLYNQSDTYADLWKNENYFMTEVEVQSLLEEMFWKVGDYNKDGIVDVVDMVFVGLAYGCIVGDPCYDPGADFNDDGIVDTRDTHIGAFHLLWQREFP
jgi:ABC-type transport system substrate-binding protein